MPSRSVFSQAVQNAENNIYKLGVKYRRKTHGAAAVMAADICNTLVEDNMQGSKPVMQKSPVSFGAHSAPHFSWTMAAQATALAAAFLFVTAMVCGAI